MTKKVIQVPIDEDLLRELDDLSRKRHMARSALIRQACSNYLQQVERERLDRLYQQGYDRIPEEPEAGEVQATISGEALSRGSW